MHFCTNYNNMYYVKIAEENENQLIYYCRKCGTEDTTITEDNICVSKTVLKKSELKFSHIINEYTKLDPTLPRTNKIKCPNKECNDDDKEVIYIRYDDTNMKYVYICTACDKVWTL